CGGIPDTTKETHSLENCWHFDEGKVPEEIRATLKKTYHGSITNMAQDIAIPVAKVKDIPKEWRFDEATKFK
ncbi:hypothetical protein GGF32_007919, partial [Allomyces javanicus]